MKIMNLGRRIVLAALTAALAVGFGHGASAQTRVIRPDNG